MLLLSVAIILLDERMEELIATEANTIGVKLSVDIVEMRIENFD